MPEAVHQADELFLRPEQADACQAAVAQYELHAVRKLRPESGSTCFALAAQRFCIRMGNQNQSLGLSHCGKYRLLF